MRRRQAIQSMLGLPALAALPAAAQEKTPDAREKLPAELKPPAVEATPKLPATAAETVADPAPRFFTPGELETLRRLCTLLAPAAGGRPGAEEAGVPEFLDFLLGRSPEPRRVLYQDGLERLEDAAQRQYRKPFAGIDAPAADALLAPLREPWTQAGPADPLARFLIAAKQDVLRATLNSRQWAAASTGRRASGLGAYWYAIE